MSKMRLLLTLCTLSIISSLQSAASSALIEAMEHTRAASVKPIEAQVAQGAYDNKLISISRNGDRIVAFDAQLLANYDFSSAIQEFKGTDKAFIESAHQLFDDLNNHQINILVKALNEDFSPARAKTFVDNIDQHDLGWLADKANFAHIRNIYEASTSKIASNPELTQIFYNNYQINDDVSVTVNDKIDMTSVFNSISDCHDIINYDHKAETALFNTHNDAALIATADKVYLQNIFNKDKTILYTRNPELDGYYIASATFNVDNSKALIKSQNRVILVDIQQPNQSTILYTQNPQLDGDSFIRSATFNVDNSKVLICTSGRIILVDIQHPDQPTILYTHSLQPDGAFSIQSATFNTGNSKVLICTHGRVILIDIQQPNQPTILYRINPQLDGIFSIKSATFNADNSKVLIATGKRALFINIQNPSQPITSYTLNRQSDFIISATFNTDNSKALITTKNTVSLVDLQNQNNPIILYTKNRQLDGSWTYSATFNADNSKVLIESKKRVILVDIQHPNEPIILYTRNYQRDGEELANKATFYADNKIVLIKTVNKVILVDIQHPKQPTTFYTRDPELDGDFIFSITFNTDNSKVLIATEKRAMLCQISSLTLLTLERLNLQQKLFLIHAAKTWEQKEPYLIISNDEQDIYNSLPDELKTPRLFKITSNEMTDVQSEIEADKMEIQTYL